MKKLLFKIRDFFVPYPRFRIVEVIINNTIEIGERGVVGQDLYYQSVAKRKFVVEEKGKGEFYMIKAFNTFIAAESFINAEIKEREKDIVWIYNFK